MTVIVCLDTGRGMTFFGRRLSTDSAVRERIVSLAGSRRLVMNAYTASQFRGSGADIYVTCDLSSLGDDDVCFAEDFDPSVFKDKISSLVIFRWNRKYPRDGEMSFYPYDEGMRLDSIRDFAGSSHERITEEIWTRTEDYDK